MADKTNQPDFDRQLEERLRAYRERIDYPPMGDSSAAARARIEAAGAIRPPVAAQSAVPIEEWDDDPVNDPASGVIVDFSSDAKHVGLRKVLALAAAVLAILIAGGALLVVLPNLASDGANVGVLGPETAAYRASGTIGGSIIPNEPVSVTLDDDGNIYAADSATQSVHNFASDGSHLASWTAEDAGIGAFIRPWDIAIRDGTVYVLDQGRDAVYLLSPDGDVQDAWHIGDPEDPAHLMTGITVDAHGMVYVTRANEGAIGVYEPDGTHVRDVVVSSDAQSGGDRPIDIAVADDGTLYVTSFSGTSVRVFNPNGAMVGEWTGINLQSRHSGGVFGVTIAQSGDVYANSESAVARLSTDGDVLAAWTVDVDEPMASTLPPGNVAVDSQGTVFMADQWDHRIVALSDHGAINMEIRDERQDRFALPGGLHVDDAGAILVADANRKQVVEFSDDGDFVRTIPWDVDTPRPPVIWQIGAVTTAEDHIYVLDGPNSAIVKLTMDGEPVLQWSGALVEPDYWSRSQGLYADDQGIIYLLDIDAGAIYRYGPEGNYLGLLNTGGLAEPTAMYVIGDTVYVAFAGGPEPGVWTLDREGNAIERVVEFKRNTDGELAIIPGAITVASTGDIFVLDSFRREVRWFGPGGAPRADWAIDAGRGEPSAFMDIAVDNSGTLFVSDMHSRQVLVYEPAE